ncbi:flagellar biosynthesis protein FlhB [Pseudogracilibacillus auburnensis]|uniref:Flagellar biosynthetic protein FlhB n=1 Tax=Pseudogracilibacillus auburnensis TaxID=1494959 RepID=A0A2V3W2Q6_9BACI|nr:flagellar biosynthesis protein FlhB [Pseudogracilibacillus auburnensis]MBO1003791.1 flagellar biosynthesis protein FlhB [Pseudogracilibacillus auburnensis]PXW88623.1 flagellar biosynthetic protein FlhB [Pseudogracilibacillus auburnensis]
MRLKLDLQFFAGEKTEKATPKKREDERKKGRVAKSQDINTALLLLASFFLLFVMGTYMKEHMLSLYATTFTEFIHWEVDLESSNKLLKEVLIQFAFIVAPVMTIAFIISIAANLLQVGFLFTTEPLKFDLKKIDPIKGAKRIFSIRALVELLKSLLKIVFIGTITFTVIWMFKDEMMMLALKHPENAVAFFGKVTIIMGIAATIALLFLAVLDYMYQKYDFEKNIRMSKQDIKDEHKNVEGDPLIKSKLREKQRQVAMRRMMAEVPKADVVITNPTHYAIAIKYDESVTSAPYVVAKGTDQTAQKIKEIAKEHQVMTMENKPLARALYDQVEVNDVIPEQFYQAVAEILAFVYQNEKRVN